MLKFSKALDVVEESLCRLETRTSSSL